MKIFSLLRYTVDHMFYQTRRFFDDVPRPRKFQYIYVSRIDFVDFYLCLNLLVTAGVLWYGRPLERLSAWAMIAHTGVTSVELGGFMFVVGLLNMIRVFAPVKPWVPLAVFMKCLMLGVFCFLALGSVGGPNLLVSTGIMWSLVALSLDNISRTG